MENCTASKARHQRLVAAVVALAGIAAPLTACGDDATPSAVSKSNLEYPKEFATVGNELVVGKVVAVREVAVNDDTIAVDGVTMPATIVGHQVADVALTNVISGTSKEGSTVTVMYDDVPAPGANIAGRASTISLAKGDEIIVAGDLAEDPEAGSVLVPSSDTTLSKIEGNRAR